MKWNLDHWKLGGQDFATRIEEMMTHGSLNLISLFIMQFKINKILTHV
jgi:hypothetical protein